MSIPHRAFDRKAALCSSCAKNIAFFCFPAAAVFLLLISRARRIISIHSVRTERKAHRLSCVFPESDRAIRFCLHLSFKGGYHFYEPRSLARAAAEGQALDAGFYHHHAGQRDLDAGQLDVRLCPEPSCAGLHRLEPALRHLRCDLHAAAGRYADLLGRDPRPLFPQKDHLHAGLHLLRRLCRFRAHSGPGLVQLSGACGVLLHHRLDQQHLLCRLRQLLSPADLRGELLQGVFHRKRSRNALGAHHSDRDVFLQSLRHCPAARHQCAVLLPRCLGRDADPRRRALHRKTARRARARRAALFGPPPAARHQGGLPLPSEREGSSLRCDLLCGQLACQRCVERHHAAVFQIDL